MKNYIDLHMHSKYSDDGEFTPSKLVEKCKEQGVKIMAIADHNLLCANEEGKKRAEELGIKYIPAIEIDCSFKEVNLHVLGYGIPLDDPYLKELGNNIFQQEIRLSSEKIKLTKELGFDISKEELDQLSDNGVYTGEMIGEVLLGKEEYKNHPLLMPYRKGNKRADNPYVNFYWDYYSQGKPCYTKVLFPDYKEVVKRIHQGGGKAVLAHPGANLEGQFEVFDDMMKEEPLDGVEAFSNYHDKKTMEYFYNKGKEYKIMTTCGSDFHGKTKPAIQLGDAKCPYDQEFIENMLTENGLLE
ncbi:MAG: PHP domain-containing protein [Anaerostipes sp.]|jgi:predicted metal-dependent phosphoesterase TrpH